MNSEERIWFYTGYLIFEDGKPLLPDSDGEEIIYNVNLLNNFNLYTDFDMNESLADNFILELCRTKNITVNGPAFPELKGRFITKVILNNSDVLEVIL